MVTPRVNWNLEKIKHCCSLDQATGCWNWNRALSTGYAVVTIDAHSVYVHRLVMSWMQELPINSEVCHKCDNPRCVNPQHLYVGDRCSNAADMIRSGRSTKGIRHPRAVLSFDNVIEILWRSHFGERQRSIAKRFGTGQSIISGIVTGKKWGGAMPIVEP
jgi:hypothetical protein